MKDSSRYDYYKRINIVRDYIAENLEEELSIDNLARMSAFSPFHFHRIFKALTGENVGAYQRRIRLEKSIFKLRNNPGKSITDISFSLGFNSSSAFNRAFKNHFGRTPGVERNSIPCNKVGNLDNEIKKQRQPSFILNTRVMDLPPYKVWYSPFAGSFSDGSVLDHWCSHITRVSESNCLKEDSRYFGIVHDDPFITDDDKCRFDCCISVDHKEVGEIKEIPGGLHAVFDFSGLAIEDTFKAYEWIYGTWFPENPYEPGDSPAYNDYYRFSKGQPSSPEKEVEYRICIPVDRH